MPSTLFNLNKSKVYGALVLLVMLYPLYMVYLRGPPAQNYRSNDIYFIWHDGKDISKGINPYSTIHGSDMRQNKKYSTYLPGFFLFVTATIWAGGETFEGFLSYWRVTAVFIHWLVGCLIFYLLLGQSKNFFLALFGAGFWLLSRWTVGVMRSGQIDLLAIGFMISGFFMLAKNPRAACILFGTSLAIKQIGVFVLPIFLLYLVDYRQPLQRQITQGFYWLAWLLAVPLLVSLPFLLWDFSGFVKSILFSATRLPGGLRVESLDELLGWVGIPAKIPMLALLLCLYMLAWRRVVPLYTAALLAFLCFISFNSVLFKQYMPWFVAFVGFAALDFLERSADSQDRSGLAHV